LEEPRLWSARLAGPRLWRLPIPVRGLIEHRVR
jgi:hypothetical protein